MTTELPRDAQLLLLDQHQVSALLQPDDVLAAVREAFVLHSAGEGQVFPVVRQALATKPLSGAIGWFKSEACQTRAGRTSGLRASACAEAALPLDIVGTAA